MADATADNASKDKKEKKKKEEDKKPSVKKSSVKKEKPEEVPQSEPAEAVHDSLKLKKVEVEAAKVDAATEPLMGPDEVDTNVQAVPQPEPVVDEPPPEPTPAPEPEASAQAEEVANHLDVPEEPRAQPRRKMSRRNYELELDEEKLNMLRDAFQIFDFNRDGVIDKDDLRKSMIAMGQAIEDIHEEDIDKMMSEACQPLDFDAFVMLLGYKAIELDPEEILRDALGHWDTEKTGLIPEEKFKFDLMNLGDRFTEKEVEQALEDAPLKTGFGWYRDKRMIDYVKYCHILSGLRKKTRDPTLEEYGLDVSA